MFANVVISLPVKYIPAISFGFHEFTPAKLQIIKVAGHKIIPAMKKILPPVRVSLRVKP